MRQVRSDSRSPGGHRTFQVLKTAFPQVPTRIYPLGSVLVGVIWVCAVAVASDNFAGITPIFGVMTGLSACGLYETTKHRVLPSKRPASAPAVSNVPAA
jgi:hypothetical protein